MVRSVIERIDKEEEMLLTRRSVMSELFASSLLTSGLGYGALAQAAAAATFPAKDITFIIPYAPGGGFDSYVRALIPAMEAQFKGAARVIPDNVDGAGGAKAASQLYRSRPDGYTISVLNVPGILILQQQGAALGFDLERLTWICSIGTDPYGLIVPMDSPLKSVADLRALSRRRAVKFPSTGPASTVHSATRIATSLLGINAQLIAGYKGTNDYIVATMRGDTDAAIASLTALNQFRASKLIRVLATFEKQSTIPGAEDATTLKLPELTQIVQLRPIAGPPQLPTDLINTLANSMMRAVKDPKVVAWAAAAGANLDAKGPAETLLALRQQRLLMDRWKSVLSPT
jgi:tripartite-type tricarboxylate transporter receptor subunit TctC